ncbi:protein rolling stone-like [Tribolium castaneum]|uniref:protein rolling stone-like n=1 Tax=Tribolium castaneum TaxID=7070 RepID=UPI00046C324E|nr:PREDICTED: protein rolling stone-like [Tribolium castaneum]|eukprot:XP_008199214.1 PREDICTED: protein rolling stone-like [Tribolium castaneum]
MIKSWKKNCSLKQLSLEHDEPITFVVSQWQRKPKPSIVYLVYRWIIALFFLVTSVLSLWDFKYHDADASFKPKWWIYVTNWGYTTCTLQSLIVAIILSICVLAPRLRSNPNLQSSSLKFYKLYWVLNVIATGTAFEITIMYWSLIYDEKVVDVNAMTFFVHANNSVLMMIDLFVVAHPIRLLHCCYPVVFGICYVVFTVIFYAAGGTTTEGQVIIYDILDWRKPGTTTVICLAALAFTVIVHVSCWGLYKFRIWTHSKCLPKAETDCSGLNKEEKDTKGAYVNEEIANDMV